MNSQPTLQDVLQAVKATDQRVSDVVQAVKDLDTRTDQRFNDLVEVIQDFSTSVDERFVSLENRTSRLESQVGHLGNQMVTKDYLDKKLGILHSDLVIRMRKEDEGVLKQVAGRTKK